jgi:hypothetical protein
MHVKFHEFLFLAPSSRGGTSRRTWLDGTLVIRNPGTPRNREAGKSPLTFFGLLLEFDKWATIRVI